MSSDRAEIVEELSKGIFQLHKHPKLKDIDIKDIKEKRNQALVKILNSTLNPSPYYDTRQKLYLEKCTCIFITQYTDQLIQYEAAIASENFWEEQRKNNSSKWIPQNQVVCWK